MAQQNLTSRWLYLALVIIAAFFILLRFVNLGYDTPLFYSNLGTSELTDPYMYTSFARNKVLYDAWNPYEAGKLISIQGSLVSGLAYIVFSIAGVSRVTANIVALLLQLGGLAFFFFGLRKLLTRQQIILSIFFLAIASLFFFGGRAPYLETGVVFASGLVVFVHFRYGRSVWGALGVGFLLAVATFGGKLTAITIAVPVIADHLFFARNTAIKNGIAVAGGFSIGLMAYAGLFTNWSPLDLINYYGAITSSVGITPSIPSTFTGIMQTIFSYGDTGIAPFHPFLLLLAALGVALASIRLSNNIAKPDKSFDARAITFMIVWIIAGLASLVPFEYRPYRYFLPYLIPVSVLAAYGVAQLLKGELKLRLSGKSGWIAVLVLLVISGYVFEQISFWWTQYNQSVSLGTKWFSIEMTLAGFVAAALVLAILYKKGITIRRSVAYSAAVILTISCGTFQSYLIYKGLHNPRGILELQNKDIAEILGDGAVLAGNFAPAFTMDNDHKNFYPYGGVRTIQDKSLMNAGITHLADPQPIIITTLQKLQVRDTIPVLKVWAREATYMIYGLQQPGYNPTDYELAMSSRTRNRLDSALFYLERFLSQHPQNLTARLEQANIFATIGKIELAQQELKQISQEYSDIYYVRFLVGQAYFPIAQVTKDWKILEAMRKEYEIVIELNPYVSRKLRLFELVEVIRKTEDSWKSN